MKLFSIIITAFIVASFLTSCHHAGVNNTGTEYMPDMGVSVAYEANKFVDYQRNTWNEESVKTRKELAMHNLPVAHTIPRGHAGGSSSMKAVQGRDRINSIATPKNGYVPFYYGDTPEERQRAMDEIIANPFPITKSGLAVGKELFDINCAICHGKKADGGGYLSRDGSPFPSPAANLMLDRFIDQSNGFYYYTIMKGRNLMGSFHDKLSYEERWQVIHYVRSLQAKKRGVAYTAAFYTPTEDKK